MADVTVDGEPYQKSAASVGEMLSRVRQEMLERGRIIASVALDGRSVPVENDNDYDKHSLSEIGRVEIQTADIREAILGTVGRLPAMIHSVEELLEGAATKFRVGKTREGFSQLGQSLGQLEAVQATLRGCEAFFGIRASDLVSQEGQGSYVLSQLQLKLRDVQQKMQAEDPLDLADTIEYELSLHVKKLQSLVPALVVALERAVH